MMTSMYVLTKGRNKLGTHELLWSYAINYWNDILVAVKHGTF